MHINNVFVTLKSPYYLKLEDVDDFITDYLKG